MVERVLENLIENAIKFSNVDGLLYIRVSSAHRRRDIQFIE